QPIRTCKNLGCVSGLSMNWRPRSEIYTPNCARSFSSPRMICRRSEEHTSELQSRFDLVCRLLLEKKKNRNNRNKILEVILSFWMQGVDFDNDDMHFNGHNAILYFGVDAVSVSEMYLSKFAICVHF